MGYSIYTILKDQKHILPILEAKFQQGNELFGREYTDGTRSIYFNKELNYIDDKHLAQGTLVGFNFSCPPTPIREYLNSVILMLSLNFSINKKYYYDGEEWEIVASREEGRALQGDWIACDSDGVVIPMKGGPLSKIWAVS